MESHNKLESSSVFKGSAGNNGLNSNDSVVKVSVLNRCNTVEENIYASENFLCQNDISAQSPTIDLKPDLKGIQCDLQNELNAEVSNSAKLFKDEPSNKSEQLICPHCSKTIKNKCTFMKHKDYCLRKITWTKKCTFCEKMFRDNYGLKRHLKVHGINLTTKTFECTYCRKFFRDNYNMSKHMDTVHKIEKIDPSQSNSKSVHFQCTRCQSYFRDRISLRRHTKIEHSSFVYKCNVCKKKFSDVEILNSHKHHCQGYMHELSEKKKMHKNIASSSQYCCSKCFGNFSLCEKCRASKECKTVNSCTLCELVLESTDDLEKHLMDEHNYDVQIYSRTKVQRRYLSEEANVCVFCLYHSSIDSGSSKNLVQHTSCSVRTQCLECGISFESEDELMFHYDTEHEKLVQNLCDEHNSKMIGVKRHNQDKSRQLQTKGETSEGIKTAEGIQATSQTLSAFQPIQHPTEISHQNLEETCNSVVKNLDGQFAMTDIDKESRILYSKSLDILFRESDQYIYSDLN